MDYSRIVKEYRERHYLTQEEFADLLGVSITSVTRWETGKFEPTMQVKKKIGELLKEESETKVSK